MKFVKYRAGTHVVSWYMKLYIIITKCSWNFIIIRNCIEFDYMSKLCVST